MSKRTDAKQLVDSIKEIMKPYMQIDMRVKFDSHCFPIRIQAIELAKLGEITNKPEFRKDEDGKRYRPPVMQITTDVGILYFILEDVNVAAIFDGCMFITDTATVEMRIMDENTTC
jgi:hypothetical protein